ncbi:MAG: hypothetical protein IKM88_12935 [Lachnospiraceae bacterium]|nr:hypothetical protein [Lachnospiraceae bacterium]
MAGWLFSVWQQALLQQGFIITFSPKTRSWLISMISMIWTISRIPSRSAAM